VLDAIADRGAGVMANRVLAALRKMFTWAIGRGHLSANPCTAIPTPTKEKTRDRVLTDDELKAIWRASDEVVAPFGMIVKLLMLTAQRRSEVAGMKWSEINADKAVWSLPGGRVKNDSGHDVPLSKGSSDIIEAIHKIKNRDFLFSTNGTNPVSGFSKIKDSL